MTWIEDVMICRKTGQFYEQKCATKTVVKLSSNEKLKPYDAVIARASAINLLGAPGEIRTRGLHIRSVLLYPLSYWRISMADQLQTNNKSTANQSDLNILAQRKTYHKQICLYI
jgi:hypothetical protein